MYIENITCILKIHFKKDISYINQSFKLEHEKSVTGLSEYIKELKNNKIDYRIEWEIIKKVRSITPDKKYRALCLEEKFEFLRQQ